MIKLYTRPRTRGSRPRWILEEIGVPYEMVNVESGAAKTQPDYLKIHPLGAVPALQDGDLTLFESSAICLHLAEKFPEKKLIPPPATNDRAHCYQWIAFVLTTLEPQAFTYFLHTVRYEESRRIPAMAVEAKEKIQTSLDILTHAIEGKEFLVGDHLTVADVITSSVVNWAIAMKMTDGNAVLNGYLSKLKERPAFRRSIA
jgi:glutathione S-transferase